MSDKKILIEELKFTAKMLKTIVSNYHMEEMARDLMNTRIINLESKIALFEDSLKLEELQHAS